MSKVKICGLRRIEDILAVNEILPDYIGFVFAKSTRQVTDETAGQLKSALDHRIKAVGVFVNDHIDHIVRLYEKNVIDLIQLHGDEDADYIHQLKKKVPCPIIKALRIRSAEDIHRGTEYDSEYLLLDTYSSHQYGGSGEAFDWTMITQMRKPFFLAGGIGIDNVEKAIHMLNPYCVDISSKVETDGWKDPDKMREIIVKIRNYDRI